MTGTILPIAAASPPTPPVPLPQVQAVDSHQDVRPAGPSSFGARLRDDPRVPAFLVSAILHTLILLALALISLHSRSGSQESMLARQGEATAEVTLQAIEPRDESAVTGASLLEQPVPVQIAVAEPANVRSPLRAAPESVELEPLDVKPVVPGSIAVVRLPGRGGLERRTPEGRQEFGKRYGATEESERAVDDALAYLAAHQRDNGSWSFDLSLDPCNGRCRNSKKSGSDSPTPSTGATGLALMAFLGAGHTHHQKGPYQETVRRGLYYLRSVAIETGSGYDWQQGSMYGHGIALMALAEALTMSSVDDRYDSDLMAQVQLGSSFTCVAQHDGGSWGYVPGSPGDTTLTAWQVMSLIAAKKSGVPPHTDTLPLAKEFLWTTSTDRDFSFGYKGPPGEPTTTAIGLTLMLYLGESPHKTPFYVALTKLAHDGPTLNNIYHDYYGTLALHHSRHWGWDEWNAKLRDHLVATQEKSGHEKGSWHFEEKWGNIGGRLYTTAMCAMTLEVYYRFMPLYESIDDFPL
jgi:hypothetical protein